MGGRGFAGMCLAVAAAAVVVAPNAFAAKSLGKFEVTGGHINQTVEFNSSGTLIDHSRDQCWQYFSTHAGSSNYRLKAKDGTIEAKPFDDSIILRKVKFAGKLTSSYTGGAPEVQHGPKYDPDDCPPPAAPPAPDTSGCGTENVAAGGRLALTELGGQPSLQAIGTAGGGMGLYGTFPGIFDDKLNCPSDSFWAADVFPAASKTKRGELLGARRTVTVEGKRNYSGKSGLLCFCDIGPNGFNSVSVDWSLKLKPLGK